MTLPLPLPRHGIEMVDVQPDHMDFFRRRTAGILHACITREMSVQSIAASCYRQGLEDAMACFDKLPAPEEPGYGHGV